MTYDPFSNLSLPVPDSNSICVNIQVFCLPPDVRQKLQGPKDSDMLGKKSIQVSIYIDHNETVGTLL